MKIRNSTKVDLAVGRVTIRAGKAADVPNWHIVKGRDDVAALVRAGALAEKADEKPKKKRGRAKVRPDGDDIVEATGAT